MKTEDVSQGALDTPHLTDADKARLLRIARETLTAYITGGTTPDYAVGEPGLLQEVAAFVTLRRRDGELRGCIGRVEVSEPLFRTVQECAVSAAVNDYRFAPVTAPELDDLVIEISALSPFRLISNPQEIVVGQHGLMIRKGFHVGLLLPQVAGDRNWSRGQFLDAICAKAGLPANGWQGGDLYVFGAEVFEEEVEQ
jgi:AmmeMemoRadiSam system protein A